MAPPRRPTLTVSGLKQPLLTSRTSRIKLGLVVLGALWCVALLAESQNTFLGDVEQPRGNDLRLARGSAIQSPGEEDASDSATETQTSDLETVVDGSLGPRGGRVVMPEYGGYLEPTVTTTANLSSSPTPTGDETPISSMPSAVPQGEAPTLAPTSTPLLTPRPTRGTTLLTPRRTRRTKVPRTTAPTPTAATPAPSRDQCYDERDLGIIKRAATPTHVFCGNTTDQPSNRTQTQITIVDAPSKLRAVVFRGHLVLNLTDAVAHGPISSLAQDGGGHDPRFRFTRHMLQCSCDAFHAFATANASKKSAWNVWDPALAFQKSWDKEDSSLFCVGGDEERSVGVNGTMEMEITGQAILMPRRDDHNPFFQVSYALNAWIMLRALQWDPRNVTLVHLDDGYPSPVDELQQTLLSPSRAIVRGNALIGKQLRFPGEVMLAPFEAIGPMMQHLDDAEPCFESELLRIFREESLTALGAVAPVHDTIVVTIITRKPYSGRMVQRRWLNEDDILAKLRAEYVSIDGKPVVFQSIDFVDLPLQRQMELMLESDVVIGMHGAGMVNVLWTRPRTLVVEIFPVRRRRWGYRNLCQHIGCAWHEFRGGTDTGMGDNASDKFIRYDVWRAFFDPLFRSHVATITATTQ